jgi:hypothetical protein
MVAGVEEGRKALLVPGILISLSPGKLGACSYGAVRRFRDVNGKKFKLYDRECHVAQNKRINSYQEPHPL